MHCRHEKHVHVFRKSEMKEHYSSLGADENVILKWMVNKLL
jgi:hypothetical protein